MKPLYTEPEYEKAHWCQWLSLECEHCHQPFLRTKRAIRKGLNVCFCSKKCDKASQQIGPQNLICAHCGTSFVRRLTKPLYRRLKEGKPNFCSKKCSALHHGAEHYTVLNKSQTEKLCQEVKINPAFRYNKLAKKYRVASGTIRNILAKNGIVVKPKRNAYVFPCSRFGDIRRSAISQGHMFAVDKEYLHELFLKQNRTCAYTGWQLTFDSSVKVRDGTASLDRIDSSKGYIPGNVQWVHKYINVMKSWQTHSDFIELCKAVVRQHGSLDSTEETIERIRTGRYIDGVKWKKDRLKGKDPVTSQRLGGEEICARLAKGEQILRE